MFLQTIEKSFPGFSYYRLANVNRLFSIFFLRGTKQEIDAALLEILAVFALLKHDSWNLICDASPVCQRTFSTSRRFAVH